jgi:hypothetical protein
MVVGLADEWSVYVRDDPVPPARDVLGVDRERFFIAFVVSSILLVARTTGTAMTPRGGC